MKKGTLPLRWVSSPGLFDCRSNALSSEQRRFKLKENLRNAFDEHGIDKVSFEMRLQTDRCDLQTLVMDTDVFLDDFCKRLLKSKTYHFVSKMQSSFFKKLKENLLASGFLICFDFAENYAFVVQNSAQ